MKVLKSHRDEHFLQWNRDDYGRMGHLSHNAKFDYVPIKSMQRGDVTQESKAWLKKTHPQNFNLLEVLRTTIPRDGMSSPLILVSTDNPYWAEFIGKDFWSHIPYVIQTGNNRFRVAVENDYTHISSIILGSSVPPPVFNFLQTELKKTLGSTLNVKKSYLIDRFGITSFGGEESQL